jgi:hypothetical protein
MEMGDRENKKRELIGINKKTLHFFILLIVSE